ncbi:MAG: AAA family ATPase [Rhodospirillaceae bacterium]|jgi:general secretion pathway protein A|nr:AAA family ATPase [Rhodospirillaceae bacterium]MBT7484767.1 AAA family ATPase [Rhodospirillales bacterium]MBT5035403.1 AAA family ATPase [Rhodospirillaceae bacterium]MBT6221944.1 AAA family ATPase [Rhodospirillaceae bacterium]MBT6363492.1 AAA family ATPase [Rhodospirillaceae bacterium]
MFWTHFGIEENAFSNTPDPKYFFLSQRHQEALAHLMYGVRGGSGFVMLTGEVGTGKTTVSRCLVEQLPASVDMALCVNPRISEVEMLATICDELGVSHTGGMESVKQLMDVLNSYLLDAHARRRRTVLVIDEAQNLSPQALEQVRLLTNLETHDTKLLQIILIAQPELKEILEQSGMRQFNQRITARYHLDPMTKEETRAYILHRLSVGGIRNDVFKSDAMTEIFHLSGGVPRLINSICERCLLGAYAKGKHHVDRKLAQIAGEEVLGANAPLITKSRSRARRSLIAGIGLMAASALAVFAVLDPFGLTKKISVKFSEAATVQAEPLTVAQAPKVTPSLPPAKSIVKAKLRGLTLENLFGHPDINGDSATAMAKLISLWNKNPDSLKGLNPCADARAVGLRCLERRGTWAMLAGINLPSLISLADPNEKKVYAVITGLSGPTVTLDINGRRIVADTAKVTPFWSGDYLTLWKRPPGFWRDLEPGMQGEDVLFLRQSLAKIWGGSADVENAQTYDAKLKEQVTAFQKSRQIKPTGIVRDMTLLLLNRATENPSHPSLSEKP